MSSGFNSNVRVGEIVYHVQTEQRGEGDATVIDTVVYISGRVIHRVETNLRDAGTHDGEAQDDSVLSLNDRVERQHQAVVALVESGALRLDAEAALASDRAAKAPTLTIRPVDRGSWLAGAASAKVGEHAVATISVEVIFPDETPAAGATVEARREANGVVAASVQALADTGGKATLELPLDPPLPDAVFVVTASSGDSRGELRFRMKARVAATDSRSET